MNSIKTFYVSCVECGEQHSSQDDYMALCVIGLEEDTFGRDVLTYNCPRTGNVTKAYIYTDL